jgi:hypothetical protein
MLAFPDGVLGIGHPKTETGEFIVYVVKILAEH